MRWLSDLWRFARCRCGAAGIEAAFVIPVFASFCLGTMEFGRMFWIRSSLQFAAEEAARYALAHPDVTDKYLQDFTAKRFGDVSYGALKITVTRDTVDDDSFVTVDATYDFEFVTSFIPADPMTLEGKSRVPLI
jgi:Flp pilus assembly protein TadG